MPVTITSPKDSTANRKNTITFSWTTSIAGQNAYEFMYRLRTESTWKTKGKVNSTATSAKIDVSDLIDGRDYYYQIVLYYTASDATGVTITGFEKSQAYTLVLNTAIDGTLKIKTDTGIEEIPLYSETNNTGPKIKVKISSTKTVFANFAEDNNSAVASGFRINTGSTGIKSAISRYGKFKYSGIAASGELDSRYTIVYTEPAAEQYYASKYDYVSSYYSYFTENYYTVVHTYTASDEHKYEYDTSHTGKGTHYYEVPNWRDYTYQTSDGKVHYVRYVYHYISSYEYSFTYTTHHDYTYYTTHTVYTGTDYVPIYAYKPIYTTYYTILHYTRPAYTAYAYGYKRYSYK